MVVNRCCRGKRRLPFLFLQDIADRFKSTYGDRAKTAIAFAMNSEFAHVLQSRMECVLVLPHCLFRHSYALIFRRYINDNPNADNFGKVREQLADVKEVMVDNIGA
jgi:vesicle-associated membrane protein 7